MKMPPQPATNTSTDEPVIAALKPAEIVLKVTDFKDVLQGTNSLKVGPNTPPSKAGSLNTVAVMKMKRHHSRVGIDSEDPNTIWIKPHGATIRFTIKPAGYFPIGIAFKLLKGQPNPNDLQRIGYLNFEQARMPRDAHTLSITDSYKDDGDDDRYKFSVIIQQMSDGAIGIIDPDIKHLP
jgi:hypothetical protein